MVIVQTRVQMSWRGR